MARLVFGVGSSHGPTLQTPPEGWPRLGVGDTKDPRFNFDELAAKAKPGIADEITPEVMRRRHARNQAGLDALVRRFQDARLDAVVVISNPHRIFPDDAHPVLGVYRGDDLPVQMKKPVFDPNDRFASLRAQSLGDDEMKRFPAQPSLATHLLTTLIDADFDVASVERIREGNTLDDAFAFLYERFAPDGAVPAVPFFLSRYRPYQPTARRAYALGKALGEAIASWDADARVGVLASGGLSHQVLDEELDRAVIAALEAGDADALRGLDSGRLNIGPGTPEVLNWVAVAGAMAPATMQLVDYIPCYRSLAGTGHGITFGYWEA
jgi:hypothetical protein